MKYSEFIDTFHSRVYFVDLKKGNGAQEKYSTLLSLNWHIKLNELMKVKTIVKSI